MDMNRRINSWAAEHPAQYALVLGVALAPVYLLVNALTDRPFFWPSFVVSVVIFPIAAAAIARRRFRACNEWQTPPSQKAP